MSEPPKRDKYDHTFKAIHDHEGVIVFVFCLLFTHEFLQFFEWLRRGSNLFPIAAFSGFADGFEHRHVINQVLV